MIRSYVPFRLAKENSVRVCYTSCLSGVAKKENKTTYSVLSYASETHLWCHAIKHVLNNMAKYSNIIVVIIIVSVITFNAGFFFIKYKKGRSRVISFKFSLS